MSTVLSKIAVLAGGWPDGIFLNNWVAPCKPAQCDYFVVIFQVAQNQLKFDMSTLPVFFFKNAENMDKIELNSNPPPPPPSSLSVSKQCRISILDSQNTVRVSFMLLVGGGGGGLSRTCLKPCFSACGKKCTAIFSQKKSQHAKFQRILSNLENRYEIVT